MRPTIRVLDPPQIDRILHEAGRILAEVGYEVRGPRLRKRLIAAGLPQDPQGRILFPQEVVTTALASTPSSVRLFDRDGKQYADLGGDRVHFVPGSSGLQVLDAETGEVRLANTRDFTDYVRLCDGLEHIHYLATAFSTNRDIDPQVADAWRLYLTLTQSKKPVVSGAFTEHGVPRMAEMMATFRDGRRDLASRPMSIFTITATGNFRYSEDSCQNLLDCADWGIPVEIVPVTIMGLIAPVTLVEAAVFHVADVLAGLVMAQLARPGVPVLFGGAPATFHMRAATSPMMAIEALRLDLAYLEVAKHLDLPTQAYMAFSDSKLLDAQAGAETLASALLAAIAGVNSVSGPGMLDYLLVFSPEKLVFDNEMCGQALHFVSDPEFQDSPDLVEMARRLISEDHLLTDTHTIEHWRKALFLPGNVIDRLNRDTWSKAGGWRLMKRARAEVQARLQRYTPPDTDPKIVAELQRILRGGMREPAPLPDIPPPAVQARPPVAPARRGRKFKRKK